MPTEGFKVDSSAEKYISKVMDQYNLDRLRAIKFGHKKGELVVRDKIIYRKKTRNLEVE